MGVLALYNPALHPVNGTILRGKDSYTSHMPSAILTAWMDKNVRDPDIRSEVPGRRGALSDLS